MAPAECLAQPHRITGHHQIEIGLWSQAIQQGVAHCAPHQGGLCWKGLRGQWPRFGLQALPGQLSKPGRVHNGPIRCGAGHVHLRGLPLG